MTYLKYFNNIWLKKWFKKYIGVIKIFPHRLIYRVSQVIFIIRQINCNMKKVIIILLLCIPIAANAANYYVATTGNDNNPGTIDTAILYIK